jgi:transcriptional regulator with XRE-family HTH domain
LTPAPPSHPPSARRGWTQQQLADAVFVSHSRITQIELASDPPNEPLSALLDTALGAEEDINIAYYHMAREGIRDWAQPYANMEARASLLRTYNPQIIPASCKPAPTPAS